MKSSNCNILFSDLFRDALALHDYIKVKTIRLQGIVLSLYTLRKHVKHLRDIETQYTRTGFGRMWVSVVWGYGHYYIWVFVCLLMKISSRETKELLAFALIFMVVLYALWILTWHLTIISSKNGYQIMTLLCLHKPLQLVKQPKYFTMSKYQKIIFIFKDIVHAFL